MVVPPSLTFTSLSEARRHRHHIRVAFQAVLSIEDVACDGRRDGVRFISQPCPAHLVLRFDDTADTSLGAPRAVHIRQIAAFATQHRGSMLLHCHAGISRSAAAFLIAFMIRDPVQATADDAIRAMREINPLAIPNARMLRLADETYHFGLADALKAAPRSFVMSSGGVLVPAGTHRKAP